MAQALAHSRLLRSLFFAGGLVATGAGIHTALAGHRSVPGNPEGSAIADSELRYYSAFYAAQGVRMLRIAASGPPDPGAVREAAAAVMLGGISRLLSWRQLGRPHDAQLGLLAIELLTPPALVSISRRANAARVHS